MEENNKNTYLRHDVFTFNTQNEKLLKFLSEEEHNYNKLEDQFRDITKVPTLEIDDFARNPSNKKKNRYGDVLPLKGTVVKLNRVEEDITSEYINANFVQDVEREGMPTPQKYICTQAPLPFTFIDFWRMVWDYNVHLILMLTGLIERKKSKADIYWPRTINSMGRYGNICVKLVKEKLRSQYITIRYFDVWYEEIVINENSEDAQTSSDVHSEEEKSNHSENNFTPENSEDLSPMEEIENKNSRRIIQIHISEWPDFGVPNSTEIMKELINEVDIRKKTENDPIIVHCSAGVGRTGTFCAIHMCLQRFKIEQNYDIKETVINLRKQRIGMVQSLEQYMFVHQVVSEITEERDFFSLLSTDNKSIVYDGSNPPKKGKNKDKETHQKRKSTNMCKKKVIKLLD